MGAAGSGGDATDTGAVEPRFLAAGDTALVVEFGTEVDPAVNHRVMRLGESLRAAEIGGVVDLVPTFRSLMVHYDPTVVQRAQLEARVRDLLCHCSGLVDRAGYVTDPPDDLPSLMERSEETVRADWAPGRYFFYANINYVLLGAVVELDRLQRVVNRKLCRIHDESLRRHRLGSGRPSQRRECWLA